MKIQGKSYRTVWEVDHRPGLVQIIDQRYLPHQFVIENIQSLEAAAVAIKEMHVRGAPLIGALAAYGMSIALYHCDSKQDWKAHLAVAAKQLKSTRPTAVNLAYAVDRALETIQGVDHYDDANVKLLQTARAVTEESVDQCRQIGEWGLPIIEEIYTRTQQPVQIITHCNAGWLACVDYGTATAPIYAAHDKGIPVHVWVDETRPRNQGARLTAFELLEHGVPHTVIVDNAGGHLMQHGQVDVLITGTDRTTRMGDVANKIGTYLKALAAYDNGIPFYVGTPSSSIDWKMRDGLKEIPIEQRGGEEVSTIQGLHEGEIKKVLLTPEKSPVANFAFDVTPAKYVTGLITERGVCAASEEGLIQLFPEFANVQSTSP